MKLSRASALGVFASVHLATSSGKPIGGGDIATALGVPVDSLLRVLQTLVKARILRSTRGRGGGFSLDRPPQEINLLSIVEAIEGPMTGLLEGLDGNTEDWESRRMVEAKLQRASSFARDLLTQTTIADLLTTNTAQI